MDALTHGVVIRLTADVACWASKAPRTEQKTAPLLCRELPLWNLGLAKLTFGSCNMNSKDGGFIDRSSVVPFGLD